MIDRYTRPEMGRIWTLENRYRAWLDVEVAVCRAWSEMGRIPAEAVDVICQKAAIDVDRILAIEEVTRHDVIAFLERGGRGYLYSGMWKMYHRVEEGKATCEKYRRCTLSFLKALESGARLDELCPAI